jgi:hypothetical protein
MWNPLKKDFLHFTFFSFNSKHIIFQVYFIGDFYSKLKSQGIVNFIPRKRWQYVTDKICILLSQKCWAMAKICEEIKMNFNNGIFNREKEGKRRGIINWFIIVISSFNYQNAMKFVSHNLRFFCIDNAIFCGHIDMKN